MPDLSAENPIQPEQKKPSIAERVKGRLAEFWQRVGPGRVNAENMKTFQAINEALGPGKAQEVHKLLEGPFKALSAANAIGMTCIDVSLGVVANSWLRGVARQLVVATSFAGGLPGTILRNKVIQGVGLGVGYGVGETIRTVGGAALGVGVAELGVAHKAAILAQNAVVRPIGVRVAEAVGNITRGWGQKIEPAPKPVG